MQFSLIKLLNQEKLYANHMLDIITKTILDLQLTV